MGRVGAARVSESPTLIRWMRLRARSTPCLLLHCGDHRFTRTLAGRMPAGPEPAVPPGAAKVSQLRSGGCRRHIGEGRRVTAQAAAESNNPDKPRRRAAGQCWPLRVWRETLARDRLKPLKLGRTSSWGEKRVHYGKTVALSGFVVAGYAFSWWIPVALGAALVVGGCVAVRFVPHRVHSRR